MSTRSLAARLSTVLSLAATMGASAGTVAPTRFAAFGDIGNTADSAAVAKLTRNQGAQFILMLGDLCYGAQPLATQVTTNYMAEKAGGKLWPALGNHEFHDTCGGGKTGPGYQSFFRLPNNERYYDFTRGPVHFFALSSDHDSDGVNSASKQAMWLKGKLAASKSPWQIVFFHHPPHSSGTHGSSLYMRWPFEAWGVDAVLSAHDHDYERFVIDANGDGVRIPYFVSGLGGRSRRPFATTAAGSVRRYNRAFGALFVTATSTSLTFEFRNASGALVDRCTITRRQREAAPSSFGH